MFSVCLSVQRERGIHKPLVSSPFLASGSRSLPALGQDRGNPPPRTGYATGGRPLAVSPRKTSLFVTTSFRLRASLPCTMDSSESPLSATPAADLFSNLLFQAGSFINSKMRIKFSEHYAPLL